MDSTERSLIEAIHADPRDDGIRLIYADWLEEHGSSYGEFIRIQCHEPKVLIITVEEKPIAVPDTPEYAVNGRRLLELFPAVIASERFSFWDGEPLFRGLWYVPIRDSEAMKYDPPPLVRLSLSVSACGRLLEQLLPRPIMTRVDHLKLSMQHPKARWDGYEDQLLALLEWPGLKNLDTVTLSGAPCEAAERLSQRVEVRFSS